MVTKCLYGLLFMALGATLSGVVSAPALAAAPWTTVAASPSTRGLSAHAGAGSSRRLNVFATASLAGTGAIAGTVTAKASGEAVAGVEVCALDVEDELFGGCAETAADGTYEIDGLNAGDYAVEFFVAEGSLDLLGQFYDGKPRRLEAQPVEVSEGAVAAGIDAALVGGATISGIVSGPAAAASAGIEVCAEPLTGGLHGGCTTTSGTEGAYSISGLSPGLYEVSFSAPAGINYATEFYDGSKDGTPKREGAEPVELLAEGTRGETNARMHVGGTIEGTVIAAKDSSPLAGIEVCAFQPANEVGRCATSGAAGGYQIDGLAGGATEVSFEVAFTGGLDYAEQFYDRKSRPSEADLLAVEEKQTLTGIDAVLQGGGRIEGLVTSAATGQPLSAIEVCAYPVNPEVGVRCALSSGDGRYQLTALAEQSYDVEFFDFEGEYATRYYKEASAVGEAEAVAVRLESVVGSVDAALVASVPLPLSRPTISGRAVEGETLSATHAAWTGKPTSYLDEWGLCPTAEVSEACATVATGETITLTSADVGDTIALREKAGNAAGLSASYVYARNTAIVVQHAPEQKGTPPAGGQVGQQGLGGGVLGSTSRLASVAQLKALLAKLLRSPTGHAARIGSLVGHDGYGLSFRALAAGSLNISWYAQPRGAAHPVLVAHVNLGLAGAGRAKANVALTARGRRMLRHATHAGLRVLAKGVLVATGQTPVSATRHVTLMR